MRSLSSLVIVALVAGCFSSCMTDKEPEKKPVPPQSSAGKMPWNVPQAGQGGGQFGMIPQLNQRR